MWWILEKVTNGKWDSVLESGRKNTLCYYYQLDCMLSSVARPTLECGKGSAFESVLIAGAKKILGCSSQSCSLKPYNIKER